MTNEKDTTVSAAEEIFGGSADMGTVLDLDFSAQSEGTDYALLKDDVYLLQVDGADLQQRENKFKNNELETVVKWEFGVFPLKENGKVKDVEGKEWKGGERRMWATTKVSVNNMKDGTPAAFKQIVAAILGQDPLAMNEKIKLDFSTFVGEKIRGFVTFALSQDGKKYNKVKSYMMLEE